MVTGYVIRCKDGLGSSWPVASIVLSGVGVLVNLSAAVVSVYTWTPGQFDILFLLLLLAMIIRLSIVWYARYICRNLRGPWQVVLRLG